MVARWPSKDLVAVGVSVLALILSGLSFIAAGRPADVKLVLVERVHLSTSPGARLYLQPTFVSTAANGRAEVIDDVEVTMTRTGDPTAYQLRWAETGTFEVGPFPDYAVAWKITALEPQPIVVTPSAPQTPVLQLYVADGFDWQPGSYQVEVRATRLVSSEALVASLSFELKDAGIAQLHDEGPARFVTFPATRR